jgi:hypothetical protein
MGSLRGACQRRAVSLHYRYRLYCIRARAYNNGNFVVILFGSKVPFIPRNIDDGMYRIVDAVYVDGIMAGELIADGANFTETEFKLR